MNRFILSEEEKKEILSLHKKYISEDASNTANTVSNTASTVSNTASTQTSTVIAPGVYNDKVLELQNLLKTKHAAGIAADGKLGPKTLGAVENVLQGKPATPNVSTQNKVSSSVSTSGDTTSGNTTPTTLGSTTASTTDNTVIPNQPIDKELGTYDSKTDMVYKPGSEPINTDFALKFNPNFNSEQGKETE
jgi:hypothetical protein